MREYLYFKSHTAYSSLTFNRAHLSPPFIGQGLNSGFRDAIGLSWRLARILKGQSEAKIMQSYSLERRKHTQHLIDIATGHGDLICELDSKRADELVRMAEHRWIKYSILIRHSAFFTFSTLL